MLFINSTKPAKDISTRELQSLKNRVDFYVDHYTLIKNSRENVITYEDKLNLLSNLNNVIETELNNRKAV